MDEEVEEDTDGKENEFPPILHEAHILEEQHGEEMDLQTSARSSESWGGQ